MSLNIVSLFAGCGGLDLGFHELGAKLVYACDSDISATKCFNYNLGNSAILRDVTSEAFDDDLKNLSNIDVVLGGFPCQGFSKSGPKKKDDPRNVLYKSMVKAVKILKPKVFIAENVDGIAQNFKGKYIDDITGDFEKIGYKVEYRILNAVNFGIPQFRRRIIFVGILNSISSNNFKWPEYSHEGGARNGEFKTRWDINNQINLFNQDRKQLAPPITIGEAIGDLTIKDEHFSDHTFIELSDKQEKIISKINEGQKLCNVRFSETSVFTWEIPEVFGKISKREKGILEIIAKNRRKKRFGDIPNGNPLSIAVVNQLAREDYQIKEFEDLVYKNYLKQKGDKYDLKGAMFCSGLYKRPQWNAPAPTIITVFHSPRYFVHPKENRPFTIRECARLQSFPDSFCFLESGISKKDAYRLIGNAVPPLLGRRIAEKVFGLLNVKCHNETKELYPNYSRKVSRV